MAKLGLIFTTDYEIFGNGTGCVENCVIKPTEQMANLLERHGAKLTIFFEVCEYWAFEKEYAAGHLKQDWAGLMRNQARDLLRRGHDVQLHFHPQWLDYRYDGHSWKLNYDLWRIGFLPYENEVFPERGLKNLFARGKATLEDMLKPVQSTYTCEVFRAGAWSIQPEKEVLRAMKVNGFKVDSTVVPGLFHQDEFSYYNFLKAPSHLPFYTISDVVTQPVESGSLREVPIFAAKVPLGHKLRFLALRQMRKVPFKPRGCKGSAMTTASKSKIEKVRELLFSPVTMSTFGDATVMEQMKYLTELALKNTAAQGAELIPMVWISHPKTFANERELENFLGWAKKINAIEFTNFKT